MQQGISEILKKINAEQDIEKRKQLLAQQHQNQGVLVILKMAFHPDFVTNLPEGAPPYNPCQQLDQQGMLYQALRTMYLYYGEGNPNVSKNKREAKFVQMVESLDPPDALLIIDVKDKKLPYPNITKELVEEVYPGLLT